MVSKVSNLFRGRYSKVVKGAVVKVSEYFRTINIGNGKTAKRYLRYLSIFYLVVYKGIIDIVQGGARTYRGGVARKKLDTLTTAFIPKSLNYLSYRTGTFWTHGFHGGSP